MQKHIKRILDHLWGPTGSVIFHVILIVLLVKFIQFTTQTKEPTVEVVMMETVETKLDEIMEPEKLEDLQDVVDAVTPPEVDLSVDEPPPVDNVNQSQEDFSALEVVSDVSSPLVMKGLYAGRSAGGRAAALGQYGGRWAKATEAAVIKALEWLKNHQDPDGSWGPKYRASMTGLGLLTFLAHGETPASEKYGPTVEKAIRYLVGVQEQLGGGRFANFTPGQCAEGGGPPVYEHAIATYAISEAYGLTRIPALKPVMDAAAKLIVDGQQNGGGWDYRFCKGGRRDISVAGWQIQALKSAYIAGATDHDGIKKALDKAIGDLVGCQHPETGQFAYSEKLGRSNEGLTAIGVLCLQLLGQGEEKAVRDGIVALQGTTCNWKEPLAFSPMYAWYYITQAKFHHGGQTWSGWNDRFARTFVGNQNEDGSWTAPAGREHAEGGYGPVYSTTLAALSLQVYYRFLPTYKAEAVQAAPKEEENKEVGAELL
jgi:hypothetical protein